MWYICGIVQLKKNSLLIFYNYHTRFTSRTSVLRSRHFPALATGNISRACTWFYAGYLFSCACNWLHAFPRLQLVTCFPALTAGCMFPRAYSWLHVSLRLQLVTCFPGLQLVVYFPALAAGYMFPRAYSWLHVSPRLQLVTCFLRACCWSRVS